jgi:hypothetical protein
MSTAHAGLVITPIFWEPSGGLYAFPPSYQSIVDGFMANLAAASGANNDVMSITTEYPGSKAPLTYSIRTAPSVIDTDPFPSHGCAPASGYRACVTDDELRAELTRITKARRLPTDLAHFYPVFYPPQVEAVGRDGTTSVDNFCSYHMAFGARNQQTAYAIQPYPTNNCTSGQAPNGNAAADSTISLLSHELIESETDPIGNNLAWTDKVGHEIADMCGGIYGRSLGSTNASNRAGTEYNQVVNSGKYYIQLEFSNIAFAKLGPGNGCVQSEVQAKHPTAARSTFVIDATPTELPADGSSTSTIRVIASDLVGDGLPGDRIHYTVGVESGAGQCGKLSSHVGSTNAEGLATVTYTTSTDNVACWVLANDAEGGRAAEAVIYQGTSQKTSPALHAAFPTALRAGGSAVDFTIRAANPSSLALPDARGLFIIYAPKGEDVKASEVRLYYSTTGPHGSFIRVPLVGSTNNGHVIQAYVGPVEGAALPPDHSRTYTFRVTLASNAPISATTPRLDFEAYLDQMNPADGSGASVADTSVGPIVLSAAPSHTLRNVLIAVGAALLVALAILGLWLWRRRKAPPQGPSASTA